ncbi:MAG: hypothetical protein MZV49_20075 [Rhodopseudomonas palustris]|nr:hypothetical protein [Rhodopseudomonas palustris]
MSLAVNMTFLRHLMAATALLMGLALAGCGAGSEFGGVDEDRSNQPFPQNFRAELLAFYKTYLTNPVGVREAVLAEPVLRKVGGRPRYVACVRVTNVRASPTTAARFTASRRWCLSMAGSTAVDDTEELCSGVSYAPFADLEKLTR